MVNENRKLTENLLIRNKNVERLESDIDGLKTENVLLKSRIDELSKEKITLKTEITDLKRKIDDNNTDTFVKNVIENDDNCRHYTGFLAQNNNEISMTVNFRLCKQTKQVKQPRESMTACMLYRAILKLKRLCNLRCVKVRFRLG